MDNFRLLLFFSLAIVLLLIYQAWVEDYGPVGTERPAEVAETQGLANAKVDDTEIIPPVTAPEVPQPATDTASVIPAEDPADRILVETDLLRLEISLIGGTVSSAWLKQYPVSPEAPESEFQLLRPVPPNMFIAESGIRGSDVGPVPADTRTVRFTSSQPKFVLGNNEDSLDVRLTWGHPSGVKIAKRFLFARGSYEIRVEQEILNNAQEAVGVRSFAQLQRTELYDPNASSFIYTYTGGVYYSPEEKYEKVSFDDMRSQKLRREVTDGWIAMIQHYFMAAWIPPSGEGRTFFTTVRDNGKFIIGNYTPAVVIDAGGRHTFSNRLFVGPKLQNTLASIAPGLDLAVDYGWLTILAQPIFWLLAKIYALVGNWGWAIILLTVLIKAAFYKLSETSYKSMANMRKLTPRLQALKDRYGDDKQRLNQAMMEMYKKEKINPLGGCLPIVVQIPVFIALYWVLLESVELRQAPFALWIDNLSAPDPYFVLPLIMGVSMFVQQKLNPAPPDPIQAKVMMSLPFVFTVFFAFFPAGLVLYWVVNNLLSIAQQWHITRNIEKAAAKH
jgi:YidC/Oxa1 family membrane protein insertase